MQTVARGEFLHRLGRRTPARAAYQEALPHTGNAVERDFLLARIAALDAEPGSGPR